MKTDLRKVEFYEILFDLVPYLSERACRKIHKQVGEVGFEDAVARALKHAPNKKGGYRFKETPTQQNLPKTMVLEEQSELQIAKQESLYSDSNKSNSGLTVRLNGENNLICSVLN
ncbi:hypothetical protein GQR58_023778 [Nymphon striatum]|nr:hypothetical protein GQR58_023778 [Nymphon striatum]